MKELTCELNKHLPREDLQMANKHVRRRAAPLIIKEMQVKTTEISLVLVRMTCHRKEKKIVLARMWIYGYASCTYGMPHSLS